LSFDIPDEKLWKGLVPSNIALEVFAKVLTEKRQTYKLIININKGQKSFIFCSFRNMMIETVLQFVIE